MEIRYEDPLGWGAYITDEWFTCPGKWMAFLGGGGIGRYETQEEAERGLAAYIENRFGRSLADLRAQVAVLEERARQIEADGPDWLQKRRIEQGD